MSSNEIKKFKQEDMELIFKDNYSVLSGKASTGNIGYLSFHIKEIEKAVKDKIKIRKPFVYLQTVSGIGDILALAIMLEVGDISRFAKVGNVSSYCRCVSSKRISNGKTKGKGNTKNGNRYLAWAFIEAAHFARVHNVRVNRYYQRKAAKTNNIVAIKALSNKLARASYYLNSRVIVAEVPF